VQTYKATNTLNGKFIIGSTFDFERRKKEHLRSKANYPFQNALRKNPEAFEWEVYEDDSDEPVLEQALLDIWFGCEQCYNLNPYASRPPSWEGKKHKEESKDKQSKSAVLNWDGNEVRREIVSESSRNREWTQESKDKIGDTNSSKWNNEWQLMGPDGTEYVVTNLRRFCKEHNLNRSCMMDLVRQRNGQKSHRGFKLKGPEGKIS
jgi:group I intron endonuclease